MSVNTKQHNTDTSEFVTIESEHCFVVARPKGGEKQDEVIIASALSMTTLVDIMAKIEEREAESCQEFHKLRVLKGTKLSPSPRTVRRFKRLFTTMN